MSRKKDTKVGTESNKEDNENMFHNLFLLSKFEYAPSIISTWAARAFVHHPPNSSLLPS